MADSVFGLPQLGRRGEGRRALVLVVDDDPNIANLESLALQADGLGVLILPDARELFRWIDQAEPQLVILDFMMPAWNGLEALEGLLIRYGERCPPIILATAFPDHVARGLASDRFASLPIDRVTVLAKPFENLGVFVAAVRRMLGEPPS